MPLRANWDAGIERGCGGRFMKTCNSPRAAPSCMFFVSHGSLKADKKLKIEMGQVNRRSWILSGPGNVWTNWQRIEQPHFRNGTTYREEGMSDSLTTFWSDRWSNRCPANLSCECVYFPIPVDGWINFRHGVSCSLVAAMSLMCRWYLIIRFQLYQKAIFSFPPFRWALMSFNVVAFPPCIVVFRLTSGGLAIMQFFSSGVRSALQFFDNIAIYFRGCYGLFLWRLSDYWILTRYGGVGVTSYERRDQCHK